MRVKLPKFISRRLNLGQIWIVWEPGQAIRTGPPLSSRLIVRKFTDGNLISEEDLGSGLVTNVGVALMAQDWTNASATLKLSNFHDTGTGTLAPAVTDTALQIPTGESRGTGTQSNSSNIYQTVGNVTFHNQFTITEWALFTASVGGTMWDHRTWSGTTVQNGDVLQFVYQLSILSGG